jgi:acetylornithine/N-succinyldiaminopimelate aminotransferase
MPNTEFIAKLRDHAMLAVGAGDNVVRLLPPLIIEEAQVREAMDALSATARDFESTKSPRPLQGERVG